MHDTQRVCASTTRITTHPRNGPICCALPPRTLSAALLWTLLCSPRCSPLPIKTWCSTGASMARTRTLPLMDLLTARLRATGRISARGLASILLFGHRLQGLGEWYFTNSAIYYWSLTKPHHQHLAQSAACTQQPLRAQNTHNCAICVREEQLVGATLIERSIQRNCQTNHCWWVSDLCWRVRL